MRGSVLRTSYCFVQRGEEEEGVAVGIVASLVAVQVEVQEQLPWMEELVGHHPSCTMPPKLIESIGSSPPDWKCAKSKGQVKFPHILTTDQSILREATAFQASQVLQAW
jgi:hypothetical protein